MTGVGHLASRIGMGLAAGAVGTAAMTLVQKAEMSITGREGSTVPANVIDEIAGVAPEEDAARSRLANLVHWGYGTGLGACRGVLASTPLQPVAADLLFFLGVWSAPLAYLPALDVAPPPSRWGAKQLAMDAGYHLVYAATVAVAWRLLTKGRPERPLPCLR